MRTDWFDIRGFKLNRFCRWLRCKPSAERYSIMEKHEDMITSQKGIDLIKEFEGFRSQPYLDVAGVATIGYGTTRYPNGEPVTMDDASVSERDAEDMLVHHVAQIAEPEVARTNVDLTQTQFDALVSFVYNLGGGAYKNSTLRRKLREGDYEGAANEFERWVYAGGAKQPGLIRRRKAERHLFETGTLKYDF